MKPCFQIKAFALSIIFMSAALPLSFARVTVDGIAVEPSDAFGLDKIYDFNLPELSKAPEGYEAVFIEHYGRHGSRYAYSMRYYSLLKKALDTAEREGVLTPFGRSLSEKFAANYASYALRMGDLTDLGISQQKRIAGMMHDNFPKAFPRDASVFASASNSPRSMMSMTAFCLGLQAAAPYLDIVAKAGREFLPGTCPRDSHNPWPCAAAPRRMPFEESLDSFQDRKLPYEVILSKLFTDVDAACAGMDKRDFVRRLYVLVAGMNSIPENERTDFGGLFTQEEFARMWLVDNYKRFLEYYNYYGPCSAVVDDMVRDADRRIAARMHGATLRFGHDHVIMPVFEIMGIEGADSIPRTADEVARHFVTWNSPMGTNIQLVFYMKKKGSGDILFKVLRNGREVHLAIPAAKWPYYSWNGFKVWFSEKK